MKKMTARQAELLDVLMTTGNSPKAEDAAFLMMTTPRAAGRTMAALARKGLAFYDAANGHDHWQQYVWCITDEGIAWHKANPDKIPVIIGAE